MTPIVWADDAGRVWKVGPFGEIPGSSVKADEVWLFFWRVPGDFWVPLREVDEADVVPMRKKALPSWQARLYEELSTRHQ